MSGKTRRFSHRTTAWLACAMAVLIFSPVDAQEPANPVAGKLRDAIETLVSQIKGDYLGSMTEIDVQPYVCGRGINASSGSAIRKLIIDEFAESKITHKAGARAACRGEYRLSSDEKSVLIDTKVLVDNQHLVNFRPVRVSVSDVEDFTVLTGSTGKLPLGPPQAREEAKVENAVATAVALLGNKQQAAAASDSQFSVELHRLNKETQQFEPLVLESIDGQAFADLKPDDIYAIKLFNRSGQLAAASVTIDGLNMFTISKVPEYRQNGKLVLPPTPGEYLLRGWHETDENVRQFEVVNLPDTLAAQIAGQGKLVNPDTLGTITVQFFAAIPEGAPPPADEPEIRSAGTRAGAQVAAKFTPVRVKFGALREVVSIRYTKPAIDLPPPEPVTAAR